MERSKVEAPPGSLAGDRHLAELPSRRGADDVEGAAEVFMTAGDALVFVDATARGSALRIKAGERRICVYRYGSPWNRTLWGFEPSEAPLDRLNHFAKACVEIQGFTTLRTPVVEPV